MPWRFRFVMLTVLAAFAWPGLPPLARAQQTFNPGQMPSMGPVMGSQPGSIAGAGASSPQAPDPPLGVNDSFVSFIDSALPRNVFGLRFEGDYNNRQPLRASYLYGRFPLPETRVDALQLTSSAEFAFTPWFSIFMEAPYRWINPEVNANQNGPGDINYGLKLCTWTSDSFIATILMRIYQPTASRATLGTDHWSLEPGLLAEYQISPTLRLEGEFRYWTSLGGSDYSGDLLRYGIGLSYGARKPGFWFVPVVEGVGWSVLSGKTMIASSPDSYIIEDAHGQTIVNAYLGLRFGFGQNLDFYLGYGRSLTGDFWNRDTYRFEMRFLY
jgi:Putative MetA-pathway of phenol degradation